MPLDIGPSLENNAGFDPNFILCSPDIQPLVDYHRYAQSLVSRNPLTREVLTYVDSLMTDTRFAERMKYLHNVPFRLTLSAHNDVVLEDEADDTRYHYQRQMLKSINRFHETSKIADLFPEPEAAAFVTDAETYARQAFVIHSRHTPILPITFAFHTLQSPKPDIFHIDLFPTTVKIYNGGTRIGPFSAFEQFSSFSHCYRCLNESQVVTAEPGDIIKPNHPHAEGLTHRFRLAIRAHKLNGG